MHHWQLLIIHVWTIHFFHTDTTGDGIRHSFWSAATPIALRDQS